MEDPLSVDISSLTRNEILARLDPKPSYHCNTERLRAILKSALEKYHPIHYYLSELSRDSLRNLYTIIFEKSGNGKYEQMQKSLANEMFLKFSKAPLATLMWILKSKKIPTEMAVEDIGSAIS